MFDFLKKSCAFKFLCSACLVCSLGSFANVYGDGDSTSDPADQIAELYVQGRLGYTLERIFLANPSIKNGKLSGTLKWAKSLDEESHPEESAAETLWNPAEDSEVTLFIKDPSNEKYLAATMGITFDTNDADNKYDIGSQQLYKSDVAEKITADSSAEELGALKPGTYEVTGLVTVKGNKTLIEGPFKQ